MKSKHIFLLAWISTFLLALTLMPRPVTAQSQLNHTGLIETIPAGGGIGTWIVGGQTFVADADTEFRTDKGPLNVGVCAEVEYIVDGNQNRAKKIASKSADDCGNSQTPTTTTSATASSTATATTTAAVTATPSATSTPFEFKGLIEAKPVGGGSGIWVIDGIIVEATSSTEFRTDKGPLNLDVCVEVEYLVQSSQNVAKKIASKSADDCSSTSKQSIHGTLDAMPIDGLTGVWTVSGTDYVATTTTIFEQSDGAFVLGGCVEVEFVVQDIQNIAVKIKTDDTCGPGGTPEPGLLQAYGILNSFPTGLIGTWTVDGISYEAPAGTEFKTQHGDFANGVCVKVEYTESGAIRTAREIETESASDCGSSGQVGEVEAKGLIETMPANGLIGAWTIGGQSYEANAQTRFEQERGSFATDRCVEVEYVGSGTPRTATKIATKRQHDCSSSQSNHEAYGIIEGLPVNGTTGIWTIGGLPYTVNPATSLEDGPFFADLLVEVHFTVDVNGNLIATRIEGKSAVSDDDKNLAIAYGLIEILPGSGFVGSWTIGGIVYEATASTKFEQDEGSFAVGICAKVRYQAESAANIAAKIETEPAGDCPNDSGTPVSRTFGFVDQTPPNGYVGTWVIAGFPYEVNASTQLKENNGVLITGAFVEVQYKEQNGVLVAHEIETHVPPEAGNTNAFGPLQITSSRQASAPTMAVWQVNGRAYTITDGSILDDSRADFVDGQQVLVNAYEQNGDLIVTKATALGDGNILYLPTVLR